MTVKVISIFGGQESFHGTPEAHARFEPNIRYDESGISTSRTASKYVLGATGSADCANIQPHKLRDGPVWFVVKLKASRTGSYSGTAPGAFLYTNTGTRVAGTRMDQTHAAGSYATHHNYLHDTNYKSHPGHERTLEISFHVEMNEDESVTIKLFYDRTMMYTITTEVNDPLVDEDIGSIKMMYGHTDDLTSTGAIYSAFAVAGIPDARGMVLKEVPIASNGAIQEFSGGDYTTLDTANPNILDSSLIADAPEVSSTYNLAPIEDNAKAIYKVEAVVLSYRASGGGVGANLQPIMYDGASVIEVGTKLNLADMPTSHPVGTVIHNNPYTGNPITLTDLNELEIGFKSKE